jgi:hypothetical protein
MLPWELPGPHTFSEDKLTVVIRKYNVPVDSSSLQTLEVYNII